MTTTTALLSPKNIVISGAKPIASVAPTETARTALVCTAKSGPLVPRSITSFGEFTTVFGGPTASINKGNSFARTFFAEGGRELVVQRVVHYTDIEDENTIEAVAAEVEVPNAGSLDTPGEVTHTTKFPIPVVNGDSLIASVGGAADQTVTIACTAASKTAAISPTYNIADGLTTIHPINGTSHTIIWAAADFVDNTAITLDEAIAYFNAKLPGIYADDNGGAPRITTDRKGTLATLGPVTGTAAALFNFTAGTTTGTGNVGDNLTGMTLAEFIGLAEAAFTSNSGVDVADQDLDEVPGDVFATISTVAVGATASIQIKASTLATKMGFDLLLHAGEDAAPISTLLVRAKWVGEYGNDLTVRISDATNGNADEFNLSVLDDGVVREVFPNCKIGVALALDPRYIETIVNGVEGSASASTLIEVEDLAATPARPFNGDYALTGGDDGISGLVDADFVGSEITKTGLRGLDDVVGIRLLACPEGTTAVVHNAMCAYAGVTRPWEMVAVLDPPSDLTVAGIITYVETTAGLISLTEYAAIYWPEVKIANPSQTVFGVSSTITVGPSGVVCGIMARTDAATIGGQYQPAAGTERGVCTSVLGLANEEVNRMDKRDLLYPKRINPINTEPGQPIFINGVLTLDEQGDFNTVSERRTANLIADLLVRSTIWARHSNNDTTLLARFTRTIEKVLRDEMGRGAFATRDPATAFLVDTGPGVNTPATRAEGKLLAEVSIATSKPAQFIVFQISHLTA